jgi:hypothetical protein
MAAHPELRLQAAAADSYDTIRGALDVDAIIIFY